MSLDCVDCGEPAMVTKPTATGPDTSIDELVCPSCAERRDNYEPPDEDGDAFRGGEYAAYLAEQCERARRDRGR